MARNYRDQVVIHLEDIGSTGGAHSFLKLEKSDQFHSGYVDRVEVSMIINDVSGSSTIRNIPYGILMCALNKSTTDTGTHISSADSDNMIAHTSIRGGAGKTSLRLRRRIKDNDEDPDNNWGPLWLFLEGTDLTVDETMDVKLLVTVWGRWLKATAL